MGLIVYICKEDFPAKIPAVLRAAGYEVSTTEMKKLKESHIVVKKPFAFAVTNGKWTLHISGSEEEDGTTAFFITVPWTLNPRFQRFYDSVEKSLLDAGAKICTSEETIA